MELTSLNENGKLETITVAEDKGAYATLFAVLGLFATVAYTLYLILA